MLEIRRQDTGQLEARSASDADFVAVSVRPCFPLSAPGEFLSLIAVDGGHEVGFVAATTELAPDSREVIESAVGDAGFLIEITGIESIEEGPSLREWEVRTAQGARRFVTAPDAWPRRLDDGRIFVQDLSGDLYVIPSEGSLDADARQRLEALID